jgi:pseudouridylate synthase
MGGAEALARSHTPPCGDGVAPLVDANACSQDTPWGGHVVATMERGVVASGYACRMIVVALEVSEALERGGPVVALETAVVTHGLPRRPVALQGAPAGWSAGSPANVEAARLLKRTVSGAGATAAMVAVDQGQLVVGLDDAGLERLAADEGAAKASARDLAALAVSRRSGGTTVAGTLAACALMTPMIRVFATGGIGGVHRGWSAHPDISADLMELARTPVCVVCAGAKSILDLPATLEALDALGVPVVGYRTDFFPRFFTCGDEALRVSARVETAAEAARLCALHWGAMKRTSAVLLVQDCPAAWALEAREVEAAVASGLAGAERAGVRGAEVTPYLLSHLVAATGERSLLANVAILEANARLAAEVSRAMSAGRV